MLINSKKVDSLLIFFIFIILASCSHTYDYINNVDKVVHKEIKKICNRDELKLFGYGGAMMRGIEAINISLVSHKRVDISEGRRMIVNYAETIRNSVNSEENLKKYLIPYPFPTEGILLSILFLQENGRFIEYGCVWLGTGGVSSISLMDGNIYYRSQNPRTDLLESYYDESYEEALAIVKSENNGICNPSEYSRISQETTE